MIYRNYTIEVNSFDPNLGYEYYHNDFADDYSGRGLTIDECIQEIDDIEDKN